MRRVAPLALTALLFHGFSSPCEPAEAPAPNFVFILVDDMGWTALSTPMDDTVADSRSDFHRTPAIDTLAAEGMRFTNAYAPAPLCTPTRAACLTGKLPARLHITTPGGPQRPSPDWKVIPPRHVTQFPEKETTIGEILRERGYRTAHLGKWHLAGGGPGRHGFDVHDGETGNGGAGEYGDPNPKDLVGITERAGAFMKTSVSARRPFYLQLSHYALHAPFKSLEKTRKAFADLPPGRRHVDVDYAAMTKDLDDSVGRILKQIDALGIAETTWVVFMSDNGGGGKGNRRRDTLLAGGKGTLWEGGILVPLIVRGPGVKPGTFCRFNVSGCDLLPTFCELAGVTALPDDVDGTSLVPLLAGRTEAFKRPREELIFHYPHYGRGPNQKPQSAVLVGSLKLILAHETGTSQLFDLSKDLGERTDLSARMPEKAAELKSRLDKYLRDVGAQMPRPNPDYAGAASGGETNANQSEFMKRADRNGDGKVSRDEFRGPKDRFDHLDRNGDGVLTADEEPRRPRRQDGPARPGDRR